MTEKEFTIWLQGVLDLIGTDGLTPEQVCLVKVKLEEVRKKTEIPNPFAMKR